MDCSIEYWLIIIFVLFSEISTNFFYIIDYYQIEYFRKYLINNNNIFPNKSDLNKCLKSCIKSYLFVILPSFLLGITLLNTLNLRPFQCNNNNYSIIRVIIYIIFADLLFYSIHRIMHIPYFYKRIHKIHHEYKNNSFSLVNHHIHLGELTLFMFPIILSGFILNVHIYELYFVSFIFNFCQGYAHSNYNFKWLNNIFDSHHHNDHHIYFNYNYSALIKYIDIIFGTYKS